MSFKTGAEAALPGDGPATGRMSNSASIATTTGRQPARHRSRSTLLVLEIVTAVCALTGGALLVAAPDGKLLAASSTALAGTPFNDWLVPGVALGLLVGVGFLLAAAAWWSGTRRAREFSIAAGAGLVLFELVELAWIGFHPLQVVFGAVGAAVVVLANRQPRRIQPDPLRRAGDMAHGSASHGRGREHVVDKPGRSRR